MALQILWRPVTNYTPGRNVPSPVAIVDHIMAGSLIASDSWFHNPASQASTHFGVGKLGQVYQWVRVSDSAWGNGILQCPDTAVPWLANAIQQGQWINGLTVSIEHEGQPGDIFPEAQYQASLALHKYLIAVLGIPADREHIIGHYQIQCKERANCPGPSFPWARLLQDLGVPPVNEEVINGHKVRGEIRTFYNAKGGLVTFGFPLTEEFLWVNPDKLANPTGRATTVQVFEREVIEFDNTVTDPQWRVKGLILGPLWMKTFNIKG